MAENTFTSGGTGPGAGITGLPETVTEYRQPSAYVRPNRTRFFFWGVPSALLLYSYARIGAQDLIIFGSFFSTVALYNGLAYVWRRRFRTRLTPRGVAIRGYFNHFVPWSDVQGFDVGSFGESQPLSRGYEGAWAAGPAGGALPARRRRAGAAGDGASGPHQRAPDAAARTAGHELGHRPLLRAEGPADAGAG